MATQRLRPHSSASIELWQIVDEILTKVECIEADLAAQRLILQSIATAVVPPSPATEFLITYKEDTTMPVPVKKKATVDFQILDNGTATATLTPVDAAGNATTMPTGATVPAWTSSSPAITVVAAADGMSASLTPTAVATSVIITATATLADGVTQLTGSGTPIDVVAGGATGFTITEQ